MAFSVTLYNTNDPPNKLNKTLTGASAAKSCTPYEPVSDLEGTIVIDYGFDYEGSNYLEMLEQDFDDGAVRAERKTYYFITDIEKVQGSKLRLHLKRDVLMTYKGVSGGNPTGIYGLDIHVTRCTKQAQEGSPYGYNSLLEDPTIAISGRRYYREFEFLRYGDIPFVFQYPDYDSDTQSQYVLGVIG